MFGSEMTNRAADEVGHLRQLAQTAISTERIIHGSDTMIDQEARDMASKALTLILAHERECGQRQTNIIDKFGTVEDRLSEVRDSLKGLYSRFWAGAGTIILILLGACGSMAFYMLTHKP